MTKTHKTSKLIFPSDWTGKWIYRSVLATPKWQINSTLNAYKYQEYISFLSGQLDGLTLPERIDPKTNWVRSAMVGEKVVVASQLYEQTPDKIPLEDKIKFVKSLFENPVVNNLITQATASPLGVTGTKVNEQGMPMNMGAVRLPPKSGERPMVEVLA